MNRFDEPIERRSMDCDEWRDWVDGLPESERISRRGEIMAEGLLAGCTLDVIGAEYDISRERVRQIVAKRGIVTSQLRRLQKQQAQRRRRQLADRILSVSLSHPELNIEELADWFETDEKTILKSLRHRRPVHEIKTNTSSARTSDADLITALRKWAEQSKTFTGDSYNSWATEHGYPGKQTPQNRFGGWNGSLIAAGLDELVQDRGGLRPQVSDDAIWAALLQFFRDDLDNYSAQGYTEYAQERGLASLATARNRLGTWAQMKDQVRDLMRYAADRDGSWAWAERILRIIPGEEPRSIVTKDQAVAAVREVAPRVVGPVTMQAYEDARRPDHPSAAMVQKRCGTWIVALQEADLVHRMSAKARHKLRMLASAENTFAD